MKNQQQIWDDAHIKKRVGHFAKEGSSFVKEVDAHINRDSKILELGCGNGADAAFFASQGHQVLATDFSKSAIKINKSKYKNVKNLDFEVLDMEEAFRFNTFEFDVVYARLSLHYFRDEQTKKLFAEIARVIKTDGILAFICKSVDDPLYGKGERIEQDMYESDHIRHFFSLGYAKECLGKNFTTLLIEKGEEDFYKSPSAYIKVIAEKI